MTRVIVFVIGVVWLAAMCAVVVASDGPGQNGDPWAKAYLLASTIAAVAGIMKAYKMAPPWAENAIDTAADFDPERIRQLKDKLCSVDARTKSAKEIITRYSAQENWGLTAGTIENLVDVLSPFARKLKIRLR